MRKRLISIVGEDKKDFNEKTVSFAKRLGGKLADSNFGIICDGSDNISSVVSEGMCCNSCSVPIVALVNGSDIVCKNRYCSIVIPTGQSWGNDRLIVNGGDVVIVLGGGIDTVAVLDFLCDYTDKQIIVVTKLSKLIDMFITDHLDNKHITVVKTVEEIIWFLDIMSEEFYLVNNSEQLSFFDVGKKKVIK